MFRLEIYYRKALNRFKSACLYQSIKIHFIHKIKDKNYWIAEVEKLPRLDYDNIYVSKIIDMTIKY